MKATIEMALVWEKRPIEVTPSRAKEFQELLRAYYMGQLHAGETFVSLLKLKASDLNNPDPAFNARLSEGERVTGIRIPRPPEVAGKEYGCTCKAEPGECRVHPLRKAPRARIGDKTDICGHPFTGGGHALKCTRKVGHRGGHYHDHDKRPR